MISEGFYHNASGRDAENAIVLATLKAFRALGLNTPATPDKIHIDGLGADKVKDVVTQLRREEFLEDASDKQGYFQVSAYRISLKGEHLLLLSDGISPTEANKHAIKAIMMKAKDANGAFDPQMPDVHHARTEQLVQGLISQGMLKTSSRQQGFFTMQAVEITDTGLLAMKALEARTSPRPEDIRA